VGLMGRVVKLLTFNVSLNIYNKCKKNIKMKKVLEFIKGIWNVILNFVKANGITGIGFGIAGFYFVAQGNPLLAGIGFGVLGTRNWDWVVKSIKTYWAKSK